MEARGPVPAESRAPQSGPPLVVRFGSLGDLVQLTVLLDALARLAGRPCDLVTGQAQAATLLSGLDSVGEIRVVAGRRRPYLLAPDQRRLVAWLRARGRSLAALVEPVAEARPKLRWLLARGGVPPSELLEAEALGRGELEHTVDFLARTAAAAAIRFGAPAPPVAALPRLALGEAERRDGLAWLAERGLGGTAVTLAHPLSRRVNRGRWPVERWVGLLREVLGERPEARVVLSGVAAEREEIAAIAAAVADRRVLPAAGELPLRRLAAVLSLADAAVGIDSGPTHVAAAMGCPQVVLFGRADPRRVAPRGAAPVEVVAALPPARWPGDPVTWHRVNRLEEIPLAGAVEAWRRLPRRGATPDL